LQDSIRACFAGHVLNAQVSQSAFPFIQIVYAQSEMISAIVRHHRLRALANDV